MKSNKITQKKVYTIYQVKEIQKKDGQTDYIISNIWDTSSRDKLADFLQVRKDNLARYTSKYDDINDDYIINSTKKDYTFFIDYIE